MGDANNDFLILRTREEVTDRICKELGVEREVATAGYLTRDEGVAVLVEIMKLKAGNRKA